MSLRKKTARKAGILYLALAITGAFGIMYIPTAIMIPTDPALTAKNILDNEVLFRLSIFSQMISQTIFIFLVLCLYDLFREVDLRNARIMVGLVFVSVPIAFLNTLNHVVALNLLGGDSYLTAFDVEQLQAMAMVFLNLNNEGTAVAQIFWGLWLFPFGLLVIRSEFIPKWIGYLLIIACFGYVINSTAHFVLPGYVALVAPLTAVAGTVAEFSIILWFLIKGVKEAELQTATT
jgi:hypothetical protein